MSEIDISNQNENVSDVQRDDDYTVPFLYMIAYGFLIAAIIFGFKLIPGDIGYGKSWPVVAYLPSITIIGVGLFNFGVMIGLAKIIRLMLDKKA